MEVFEFISATCFLTLFMGFIIKFIILIPTTIILTYNENIKVLFLGKIIKTLIVSSIIVFYIVSFTSGKSFITSLLFYILGFYSYIVMLTLVNESDKETIAEQNSGFLNRTIGKAKSYDNFMIIISLVFFILGLSFPVLTDYFIPTICYKFYIWLIDIKFISWIIYIFGAYCTIYIIRFTLLFFTLKGNMKR